MSATQYSILPATAVDVPAIGAAVHTSKQSLTVNRLLFHDWPNEEAQKPIYLGAVQAGLEDPNFEQWKVVHLESGEIVGHVCLTRKQAMGTTKSDSMPTKPDEVPAGMNAKVFQIVIDTVQKLDVDLSSYDHIELVHIWLAVGHRRRGLGTKLVDICVNKAKEANLPLTVQTEPQLHEFLLRLGFKDLNHATFDLAPFAPPYSGYGLFRLWSMVYKGV